ncbi:dynactin subunit 4 [Anopheles cruzii]|uniref:dynactin subunit 4 n=1 Tax=Anopheles cruzii TaxID=68878 RepID=UPI0022EC6AA6|nr:dynactin subunit 4 [Anopheles cruzii]
MAFFNLLNKVEYGCVCGLLNPLTKLYFCRHCLKLRCGFCVCHEVDSHFCSNCLENIPSAEAKIRKNRCNTCNTCPSCQHTLSVRSSTSTVPIGKEMSPSVEATKDGAPSEASAAAASTAVSTGKQASKKMYYLACLTCRWNSRDVGIPDQSVATGQWPEPEYPNATRFALLLEHYQSVVLHEKQERQELWRRKTPKQTKFPSLTDRTGLTVSMFRRQMGLPDGKASIKATITPIKESVARDEPDELPDYLLTAEINLKTIATLQQRLAQPSKQPHTVAQLYPQHKVLSIKRSLRCRQCDHNVIKSEYNPSSIKYRIALFAAYHVPDVRFVQCETLCVGQEEAALVIRITNPTLNEMTMSLLELLTPEEERQMIEEQQLRATAAVTTSGSTSATSTSGPATLSSISPTFAKQATLLEKPRMVDRTTNGTLKLPDSSFKISQRDDSAEFDEVIQLHTNEHEPRFIVWRKANHVGVRLGVQPNPDAQVGDEMVVGFTLHYTYVSTVVDKNVTAPSKEQKRHALSTRIYISLGKLQPAAQ